MSVANDIKKDGKVSLRCLASWAWSQAKGERRRIAVGCGCGVLRVGVSLAFIWVSKLLIDTAVSATDTSRMIHLAVIMTALMLTETALNQASAYISDQTEVKVKNRLRVRLYECLINSDMQLRGKYHSGDLLSRLTEDIRVLAEAMCVSAPLVIVMGVQLLAAFLFMASMSTVPALCILLAMPVCLVFSKMYMKRMRGITAKVRADDSSIQANMQEGLQHQIVIQTLECQPRMMQWLDRLQRSLYDNTISRARFSTFSRSMVRLGFITGYLVAFLWCVWHLHSGEITFGTMTAFLQLVARIQNPIVRMSHYLPTFVHAATSADRLIEIEALGSAEDGDTDVPIPADASIGVRFDGVTFAYADTEPCVLRDFSYDFTPGSKTALMGETGVGKSTLTKLILALLRPQQGEVRVYSQSPTPLSVPVSAATRHLMVYVPQGNSLLAGTIRDNLLLGDPDATDEQMRQVLHIAVADFVYDLPQGLDTPCGELGSGLSEGQCQRIAIARALLRRGSLLILDEFNSSLDVYTATTLMQRLSHARPDATFIFITHRSDVAHCCDHSLTLQRFE